MMQLSLICNCSRGHPRYGVNMQRAVHGTELQCNASSSYCNAFIGVGSRCLLHGLVAVKRSRWPSKPAEHQRIKHREYHGAYVVLALRDVYCCRKAKKRYCVTDRQALRDVPFMACLTASCLA